MRKVMEHVLEKMEEEGSSGGGEAGGGSSGASGSASAPESRVRLFCLDTPLQPEMDLRTVKNLLWKGPADLILTYSLQKPF